ncbi:hydroxyisourate hydrolase [Aequorivita sublithincola DSM 14238]|uniref:5-hydroxyisourate hydrolase n=1 Tax=Aequorivita sublithincola (strain DSM 14238 / LMG 21431 / ACAM 643 / 9-3) TaxID=746697 RepID=I3YRK7_AEQSU|nr:hydroxyisourate hydrolase [Aequorivita sublithincola]AFL79625.1 hydroxyisourate hydrolase [Aequorivita sublithincola DSM 14238]
MKTLFLAVLVIFATSAGFAQQKEFQLSTHILDVSAGLPAEGVTIKLEKMNPQTNTWDFVSEKKTSESGRVNDFLPSNENNEGTYRFTFMIEDYFKKMKEETFYPFVEVAFKITGKNHYHVPITLSAFGYSTYRGS